MRIRSGVVLKQILSAAAVWIALFAAAPAQAQSGCPSIVNGAVLTAGQWNACFAAKQNVLGYTPVNKAGDAMLGPLTTTASSALAAGFTLSPGVAPSSPADGNLWVTSLGLYVRINGATIGPLTEGTGGSFTATSPMVVTFPGGGVVNYAFDLSVPNTFLASQTFQSLLAATTNSYDIGTSATVSAFRTIYAGTSFVGPAGTFTTSVAVGGASLGGNALAVTGSASISSTLASAAHAITSASAQALAVGLNGATNPAFDVDASTALQVAGLKITGAVTGGTVSVAAIDSGSNANLAINAKGSGTIAIGSVSTGAVTITPATTLSAALTYGGVTLSNAVTGTGPMVLGAAPTITGHPTIEGVTSAGATGTGNFVFATSPSMSGVTVTSSFTATGLVTNADLANAATTVNGQTCTLGSTCTITATAASITVGTTTVASGTTTRVLYDAAGVLGEYAVSGSGSVAMTTSPSISGLTVTSSFTATGLVTLGDLATQATNTVLVNATSGSASPTAQSVSGCSAAGNALIWTTNTGFGCNTSITAAAVPASGITGTTLASNVVTTSITGLGTIVTGVWNGTAIALGYGGSGQSTALAARGSSGFNIDEATSTGDANYAIVSTDRMVYHTALSAARSDTLPAANSVNPGQIFVVTDFRGVATASNTITLLANGSDTVNGASSAVAVNAQYGAGIFWSDGTSRWTFFPASSGGGSVSTTYPLAGTSALTFVGPTNSGYFSTSTTNASFKPKNGDLIRINTAVYQIPAAGIAGCDGSTNAFSGSNVFVNGTTAQNLSSTTFYYVYAFVNSGTVTCDFRTDGNGHEPDTTSGNIGTEVRISSGTTPDPSRTLIGAVYTGSSTFVAMQTISWFNRVSKTQTTVFSTNRTTTSTSFVEINSEIRNGFVSWSTEAIFYSVGGMVQNTTLSNCEITGVGFNGTSAEVPQITGCENTSGFPYGAPISSAKSGLTEAQGNYATVLGLVNGGTGTWFGGQTSGSADSNIYLTVSTRG